MINRKVTFWLISDPVKDTEMSTGKALQRTRDNYDTSESPVKILFSQMLLAITF